MKVKKILLLVSFCFIVLNLHISSVSASNEPYTLISDKMYRNGNTIIVASSISIVPSDGFAISASPDGTFEEYLTINNGDTIPSIIYLKDLETGIVNEGIEIEETIKFDYMITYGTPVNNSGVINYVDESGVTSVEVKDDEIIWLKEEFSGQSSWIGLDNTNSDFEEGSSFYVKMISKDVDKDVWNNYHNLIDEQNKDEIESDKLWIMSVGVIKPDGEEYTILPSSENLYVQIPESWDSKDIETLFISSGNDEEIATEIKNTSYPDGASSFATISINHFSPYAIYDKLTDEEKNANITVEKTDEENPNTYDDINSNILIGIISLTLLIISVVYIKKENRN